MIPFGIIAGSKRRPAGSIVPTFLGVSPKLSGASVTWTGAPLGTPHPTRQLIAVVMYWAPSVRYLADATLGGTPMAWERIPQGVNAGSYFARLAAPTGSTADITVTANGGIEAVLALYSVEVPVAFVDDYQGGALFVGATSTSFSVPAANGGFIVGGFHSRSDASETTWTGIDRDWNLPAAQPSSGGHALTADPTHAVSVAFAPPLTSGQTRIGFASYKPV